MIGLTERHYPHVVRLPAIPGTEGLKQARDRTVRAREWCIGRHGYGYTVGGVHRCGDPSWAVHGLSYYFKDRNEAFEFKLRWG